MHKDQTGLLVPVWRVSQLSLGYLMDRCGRARIKSAGEIPYIIMQYNSKVEHLRLLNSIPRHAVCTVVVALFRQLPLPFRGLCRHLVRASSMSLLAVADPRHVK